MARRERAAHAGAVAPARFGDGFAVEGMDFAVRMFREASIAPYHAERRAIEIQIESSVLLKDMRFGESTPLASLICHCRLVL